jgi:hypothetical protein
MAWGCALLVIFGPGAAMAQEGAPVTAPVVLGDAAFRVTVQPGLEEWIPREGPRFDTTATVISVQVEGVEFLCQGGLADEFNPRFVPPPGYIEASPGDPFLKIGVGVLRSRLEPKYVYGNPYPVERLAPNTRVPSQEANEAVFTQSIDSGLGWAYAYRKTYAADPATRTLSIHYRLENTGTKPLLVEQYNHNWFRYDSEEGKANVSATAPFLLNSEKVNAYPGWSQSGYTVSLSRQVPPSSFRLPQDIPPAGNRVQVRDSLGGRSVLITGDFQVSRYIAFADEESFCPEIFCLLEIAPGEARSWSRTYLFTVDR